jgi:hypothetical protein
VPPASKGIEGTVSFDPGTPYAIEHLSRGLQRLTRTGTTFFESMALDTFFAAQGDRWSPAEHVLHLIKSSKPLRFAYRLPPTVLRLLFGEATTESRTFESLRSDYRKTLDAGGQAGRFSPTRERAPDDPAQRRRDILRQWSAVNDSVSTAWGKWRSLELDRTRLPHPLLGKLTAREMAIFTVYHTSHHLTLVAGRLS